ncbi:L-threonylcarbamoyladenylate synthase [Wenxinia marina]|uniref:Threonylcarbamoyl-AMP synthase n=1 Tax=Wenxinia marina DSM 24838 TaxID=1123501 RepID=A0A0D0QDD2_9RHOB|nr:L-threonylcarbamoyladenylate synthase [Wenxinia marina]KIQ70332.1 translation factor SUA5 [Wenxinia marina DSM 24838]GGL53959.1 threonylcarbamoyl-AMP synthase [Wenxinia marina]
MTRAALLTADETGLTRAADLLRQGRLVAFPTETVYGLGARADDGAAVAGIFEAKGRPRFNPLIVHLPDLAAAETLCDLPPDARRLAEAFWPGPLTLVLPLKPGAAISPLVTAGLDSLAVRAPEHPLARALLSRSGVPVAAPSANPSGRVSPTTAQHVLAGLGDRIDAVLDGGPCGVGVESTIVACLDRPRLLRAGGLPAETIEQALGHPLDAPDLSRAQPVAPGQLASHYAPAGTVRLNAAQAEPGETLLGFGDAPGAELNLSPSGDLREAAATLFAHLHALDAMGAERIAVSPIPDRGLGRAINDRLRRAAAPRS